MGTRIMERDKEFLRFIDRAGLCTAGMIMRRFRVRDKIVYRRLAALREAGLLEVQDVPMGPVKVHSTTGEGGELSGLGLASGGPPRLGSWHGLFLSDLLVDFELLTEGNGTRVLTEREIRREDEVNWRVPIKGGSGWHLPDLVVVGSSGMANGVELELSPKTGPKLDQVLEGFREDGRFSKVIYVVGSREVQGKVERSAQRVGFPVTIGPWILPNDRGGRSLFQVWEDEHGGGYVAG